MPLPFAPPLPPMLSKLSDELPPAGEWLYEPKWDGFRALVFRDETGLSLQSRDERMLARYFPELVAALEPMLPERCVLDGEIVIVGPHRRHGQAARRRLSAGQARHAQDQARAHRRLRRRRLPLAQERQWHAGRLAAARPL